MLKGLISLNAGYGAVSPFIRQRLRVGLIVHKVQLQEEIPLRSLYKRVLFVTTHRKQINSFSIARFQGAIPAAILGCAFHLQRLTELTE
jgi:hypothetical protein